MFDYKSSIGKYIDDADLVIGHAGMFTFTIYIFKI